ncbi:hypothetical protein JXI42_08285 [bacterium]|nr:hypothetical protein [bacterium]
MKEKRWQSIQSVKSLVLIGLAVLFIFPVYSFADGPERVERELGMTDAVIERVTGVVEESGCEEAIELLDDAMELQNDAYELFEEEAYDEAMRLTRQAREMASNAARLAERYMDPPDSLDMERYIEHVERFLDQNAEMIDRIGPVVSESGNEEVEELFERGVELQNEAMEAFEGEEYGVAFRLANQARLLIVRAGRMVEGDHDIEDKARRELERTEHLIEEVRDVIMDSGNESATDLFNHGVEMHENAVAMFEEGNYREAIRLTREAAMLIKRAYRMVTGGAVDPERVAEILERVDELIARAEPIIMESAHEEATELFTEAVELMANAHAAFDEENYEEAVRLAQEAKRLVTQALRMIEPRPELTYEVVERAINSTNEMIEEVGPAILESGNEEAIALYEEALEHQEAASSLLEEGELEEALNETRIAKRLIQRAARMAGVIPGGTE